RPNREADLIRVAYQGKDAPLVQEVPDLIARLFISRRNNVRTQEARSTGDFLAEQIALLHAQLTSTEEELRTFQERFGVLGIEAQSEAAVRRLAEMQADRERVNIERQAVSNVLSNLDSAPTDPLAPSSFRALLGLPSILTNPAAAELVNALNQAETARAALLDRRTVDDPEVQWATYRIRQIEEQLSTIALTYLGGLTEHVRGLDRTLAGFSSQLQQIPEQELHLARLRRQAGVTEELYTTLQLRLKEAEIMAAVDDPTVRIIDPAVFPRRPVRPNVPLSLALALMAGMVLGVGSAVAREQIDDTVHSRDELQLVGRVPVLGAIPRLDAAVQNGRRFPFLRQPAALGNGHGGVRLLDAVAIPGVGEAYRSLRTNITFARLDQAPRTIVVTSPAPGDGKSTTAANLAITMAQQGRRCLLIDGDMRRGRLHDSFGARREPGLSNVLLGQVTLDAAVVTETGGDDRPSLLTTGTVPPNPAELLGSDRMGDLLAEALNGFDVVVIDAPPLNMVTDAAVLSRHADGVLVVARAGVTQQTALAYTFDQLAAVNAPVLGSILNDADPQRERHYGSYMRGYYEPHA
ncbi:MAG TPA: polysaccharide biosynthesis tyrosine autokinase, partial [Longimicrobiales bacterium]|nr:polysaccharide biosynthesis tyrosine autokinase [Longimicrobiales bacterium]